MGNASEQAPLPPSAIGVMLLLCLAWGLNMVAVKLGNAGIPPVLQAGARSLVATALLWAWCRRDGSLREWRGEAFWPGIAAGVMFGLEFLLIFLGLEFTSAARAVLFLYSAPFFVAAGGHWLLGDRMTMMRFLGLLLAFAGLVMAFGDKASAAEADWRGDALLLLAGLMWGATTVLVKASALRRATPTLVLQYQLAVSALLLPPASLALGEDWGALALTPTVLGAFAYQALGIAFVSYAGWFWLVGRYSAARLSAFSFLTPIFGVLAGALLLGEALGPLLLGAMLLLAAGLWLVNKPARN